SAGTRAGASGTMQRHECRCGTLKRAPRRLSGVKLGAMVYGILLPLFSQAPMASDPVLAGGELKWFQLTESRQDVRRMLGPPKAVVAFGDDFESWQYQIDFADEDEFSHLLVFRRSSGEWISVTRNYETEQ